VLSGISLNVLVAVEPTTNVTVVVLNELMLRVAVGHGLVRAKLKVKSLAAVLAELRVTWSRICLVTLAPPAISVVSVV